MCPDMKRKFAAVILFIALVVLGYESDGYSRRRAAVHAPKFNVTKEVIPGFPEPNTPEILNRVGYYRYYLRGQRNPSILVLVSGYISGAGYFDNMARNLVKRGNVEVWTINRRETFMENRELMRKDIREFLRYPSRRKAVIARMNDVSRYLRHDGACMRHWGLQVQMEDIGRVIREARERSSSVFLGGWSDGGEFLMAYTNYKFSDGHFGYQDLAGVVFLDVDPEWAVYSGKTERIERAINRHREAIEKDRLYVTVSPGLPVYTMAVELARIYPGRKSPLAEYFGVPRTLLKKGITNRALGGWLFDYTVSDYERSRRSPFAYFIRSGDIRVPAQTRRHRRRAMVDWRSHHSTGEVTNLDMFLRANSAPGHMFELFYPRKLIQDFWSIAKTGFHCPELNVYHTPENRLPLFNAQTRANYDTAILPDIVTWYMNRSGIRKELVANHHFPSYSHADIFFASPADREFFSPLYRWMRAASSNVGRVSPEMENRRSPGVTGRRCTGEERIHRN